MECNIFGLVFSSWILVSMHVSSSRWKSLEPTRVRVKTCVISWTSSSSTSSMFLKDLAISSSINLANGFGQKPTE